MNLKASRFVPYYRAIFTGLLLSASVFSVDAPFPESVLLDGKTLLRNGTGIRKATVFKVQVYEAALYVLAKSSEADTIVSSPTPKQMELRFLRNVDKDAISEAWQDSFQKACEPDCAAYADNLAKLRSAMTNVKEGDRQTYQFHSKGVEYLLNGVKRLSVHDPAFGRVLLSTWIGKHPPTESLKEGLLGKTAD